MTTTAITDRLYELDLLRFFAALSVMFFHYTFRGVTANHLSNVPYPEISAISKYGYLGVDLFFMISGFVIIMTVMNKSWQHFLVSRIVRLYPAFWVACSLTFILRIILGNQNNAPTLFQYLANMTMLNPLFGVEAIDGVYWTLLVEMRFYFWIFLIVLMGQILKLKPFLAAWLCIAVIFNIVHVRMFNIIFITPYAPLFIAGTTFYLVYKEGMSLFKGLLLAVSYIEVIIQSRVTLAEMRDQFSTGFSDIAATFILTFFFIIFFLVATRRTLAISSSKYLALGALTYPLYLIHQRIGYLILNSLYQYINKYVLLFSTVAIMLVGAYLINKKIEQPFSPYLKIKVKTMLRV